jgi:hypothetical protein
VTGVQTCALPICDVISFIQRFNHCDFKQALDFLGMKKGTSFKPNKREQRKRELINAFREWCNDYYDLLCSAYRLLNKARHEVKDMQEVAKIARLYHYAPIWEYHMDILCSRDDREKFELYLEVGNGGL